MKHFCVSLLASQVDRITNAQAKSVRLLLCLSDSSLRIRKHQILFCVFKMLNLKGDDVGKEDVNVCWI